MREKLLALAALQKVDLDIAALKKSGDALRRDLADLEKQHAAARSSVDAERKRLEDLEAQRRTLDEAITETRDKVKKWQARLTEQRSTREYAALAREIDIEQKRVGTMGEDAQAFGRQAEELRELLKGKEAEFAGKSKDLSGRMDQLRAGIAEGEAAVQRGEAGRAGVAQAVDAGLLRQYDVIRKKRLPAVVPVSAPGTCSGCRMNIPAQKFNTLVASGAVDTCPSCTRMIYAAEVLEVPAAK